MSNLAEEIYERNKNSLHRVAIKGDLSEFAEILPKKIFECADKEEEIALLKDTALKVVKSGHLANMRWMLANVKIDLNWTYGDKGNTLAMEGRISNETQMVELLVKQGADIKKQNKDGKTLLEVEVVALSTPRDQENKKKILKAAGCGPEEEKKATAPAKKSRPKMCPMCRVDGTEAHLAGDWHQFNRKCTAEGKTPMSEDLFDKFEKHKWNKNAADAGIHKAAVEHAVKATTTKNVNQWHWEERNVMAWAKERIPELLKEAAIPVQGNGSITITDVKDIKGDAYLNIRKGKMRVGFELGMNIAWEGKILDSDGNEAVSCKGKAIIVEFSDDQDDDEYEEQIQDIKLEKNAKGADLLLKVMRKLGRKTIAKQLGKWNKEIRAMAQKK